MSAPRPIKLLLLCAGILLAGCATTRPPSPPSPPSPEALRVFQTLAARWKQFEDLKGVVEITLSRDRTVQRFDGVLLLKAPSSIRFEALSPFGQPFLYLISSGDGFTYYNVLENRALVGSNSADTAKRWLGIPLTGEELTGLLAGYVLPLPNPQEITLSSPDAVGPSLLLNGGTWSQRIWYEPDSGVPRQVEFTGRAPIRVVFQGGGAGTPPSSVTLTALDRPLALSLYYRSAEIRPGLNFGAFEINLPARVKVQRVN